MKQKHILKFRNGSERDLESLHDRYIWFSDLKSLNDPFEGRATIINSNNFDLRLKSLYHLLRKWELVREEELMNNSPLEKTRVILSNLNFLIDQYDKNIEIFSKESEKFVKELLNNFIQASHNEHYVFCASQGLDENGSELIKDSLMWGLYGGNFQGFCIEFNFKHLSEELLLKTDLMHINPVSYTREPIEYDDLFSIYVGSSEIDVQGRAIPIMSKSRKWKYENEIRFLTKSSGKIPFSPESVSRIIVSHKMPDWKIEAIRAIQRKIYPHSRVDEAYIDNLSDEVQIRQI